MTGNNGLEMFAQAAPAGSRLLRVSPTGARQLKAWATRAPTTRPGSDAPSQLRLD